MPTHFFQKYFFICIAAMALISAGIAGEPEWGNEKTSLPIAVNRQPITAAGERSEETHDSACSIPSAHPDCAPQVDLTQRPATAASSLPEGSTRQVATPQMEETATENGEPTKKLATAPTDLWDRIRAGFHMRDLQDPQVAKIQAWYLNHPALLQRIIDRSRRYLYFIVNELEIRNMPMELALLPAVESSFNPQAYSRAKALGIWQFIPSTGKIYQLKQDAWVDERRDIAASTTAALDYLQNSYQTFDDWFLALASYNWGEANVSRALRKNAQKGLAQDYESIAMPRETRQYVPRLLALRNIINEAPLLGINLAPIPNSPYFDQVPITANIDIAIAAKLANIPVSEFIALNPAYHRPLIQGSEESTLNLPIDKVEIFRDNLQRQFDEDIPLSKWEFVTLRKGQKAESLAISRGLTINLLRRINGLASRKQIKPGMSLLVPRSGEEVHQEILTQLPLMTTLIKKPATPKRRYAKSKYRTHHRQVAQHKGKEKRRSGKQQLTRQSAAGG